MIELEAFAAGFSKYLADHPEEEPDLGPLLKVLPINGEDMLGGGMRAYYTFSYQGASGLSRKFDAKYADRVDTFKYVSCEMRCAPRARAPGCHNCLPRFQKKKNGPTKSGTHADVRMNRGRTPSTLQGAL